MQCLHCRLNLCNHAYCDSAMNIFNHSQEVADYVGIQDWLSIPLCPPDWESRLSKTIPQEFNQTCSNEDSKCGQHIYNITTKSVLNIVVSNQADSIPVIGSGAELLKSAVVILGCTPFNHKCNSGRKVSVAIESKRDSSTEATATPSSDSLPTTTQASSSSSTELPSSPTSTTTILPNNSSSSISESKLDNLEHTNTATNCCHCSKDFCNAKNLLAATNVESSNSDSGSDQFECSSVLGESGVNNPSGTTRFGANVLLGVFSILFLFVNF